MRTPKKRVLAAILGGIILVAGASSAAYVVFSGRAAATDVIPTAVVKEGPFEDYIVTLGALKAATSTIITAPNYQSKIIRLVPEGTRVEKGDPVVWMDSREQQDQVEDWKSQLALAEKDLASAKEALDLEKIKNEYTLQSERTKVESQQHSYELAREKYETEKVLAARNISPQEKVEEQRLSLLQEELNLRNARINEKKTEENLASNLRIKQADIEKAQLRIDRAREQLKDYSDRVEQSVVKARSSGEIAYFSRYGASGFAKVAEGDQIWNSEGLAEIPDLTEVLAIVPVNELDISSVEKGQPAQVTLEALPGKVFNAVVEGKSVVPMSDQNRSGWRMNSNNQDGPREFEVRLKITEKSDQFRQGMTASARIRTNRIEKALQVPVESVIKRGDKIGVAAADGGFVPVKVIRANQSFAAVEGELRSGDRVFLRDPSKSLVDSEAQPGPLAGRPENGNGKNGGGRGSGRRSGGGSGGDATGKRGGAEATSDSPAGGGGRGAGNDAQPGSQGGRQGRSEAGGVGAASGGEGREARQGGGDGSGRRRQRGS